MVAMDKRRILDEIARTARVNGGIPLGVARFRQETGIRESDWRGKYWAIWGDALQEAGFKANRMTDAYPKEFLLDALVDLIRNLGHYPTIAEIKLHRRDESDFPSVGAFQRLGKKSALASMVLNHTRDEDIRRTCAPLIDAPETNTLDDSSQPVEGYVYLMKSGRYYKIGYTNSLDRRQYEIGLQMPEGIKPIHSIRTDDPSGIEAYWHNRFHDKRMKGEWFRLSAKDVAAFKKRKLM